MVENKGSEDIKDEYEVIELLLKNCISSDFVTMAGWMAIHQLQLPLRPPRPLDLGGAG